MVRAVEEGEKTKRKQILPNGYYQDANVATVPGPCGDSVAEP